MGRQLGFILLLSLIHIFINTEPAPAPPFKGILSKTFLKKNCLSRGTFPCAGNACARAVPTPKQLSYTDKTVRVKFLQGRNKRIVVDVYKRQPVAPCAGAASCCGTAPPGCHTETNPANPAPLLRNMWSASDWRAEKFDRSIYGFLPGDRAHE